MSASTTVLTCLCGARLDYTGASGVTMSRDFTDAHKVCREKGRSFEAPIPAPLTPFRATLPPYPVSS